MLDVTYRLNDVLSAWPSKTFYQSKLKPSPEAEKRRLFLTPEETRWDFVLEPSYPAVFLDLGHNNTTVRSRVEAEVVADLVLALMIKGVSPDEVGVVVPYRAQSRLIRSLLRLIVGDDETIRRIVVDTVERMQGQEREVILISMTTASLRFAAQIGDFLFQPQRLNVASTRPRTKLIIVGSHRLLDVEEIDPKYKEMVKLFRDLIAHCRTMTIPKGFLS